MNTRSYNTPKAEIKDLVKIRTGADLFNNAATMVLLMALSSSTIAWIF